jgi:NAD(P)H-dependent flavin oxidoreductase YrpB (nitropropane dioxygenase family)
VRTPLCDVFDIDVPIFGFSNCREVVAAISLAGGLGVFGAAAYSPDELELELQWLDDKLGGRPYGVNVLMAASVEEGDADELAARIPEEQKRFVATLDERFGIPPLPDNASRPPTIFRNMELRSTHGWARPQVEVALAHGVRLLSSALGPAPADIVEQAHARGAKVAGTVGAARHVPKHVAVDTDLLVAAGVEGAGHNSDISTMVLTPEIVDAAGEVPVLAAGGIASGRQVAAALALGAQGVWCGSVWLTTVESDLTDESIERILKATSADTIRTKSWSGKPTRFIRNAWMEAWEESSAPPTLPTPLQRILVAPHQRRIVAAGLSEITPVPVGQVAGQMNRVRRVADVIDDLVVECDEAVGRLESLRVTP